MILPFLIIQQYHIGHTENIQIPGRFDEICGFNSGMNSERVSIVSLRFRLLLFSNQQILRIRFRSLRSIWIRKDLLGIQKFGANLIRLQIDLTNDENLGGFETRSGWFPDVNPLKQLLKDTNQTRIIVRTEHFCHESTAFSKDLSGEF
ncbi:hypothetical protein GCK72_011281 [Caenorhabditis remanei]|uniref:Uncharacterized protein n=1 Tax=Caenorhabditis remanei TaxID=31234 RepID=A0A6A5H814_CAERE|nr:hypothetical protein GCK72_011281 [Caenorhabditis remanei]KAF1763016.1 hypothetical protein GCK72_011281 [Caenorhabditis remanei]